MLEVIDLSTTSDDEVEIVTSVNSETHSTPELPLPSASCAHQTGAQSPYRPATRAPDLRFEPISPTPCAATDAPAATHNAADNLNSQQLRDAEGGPPPDRQPSHREDGSNAQQRTVDASKDALGTKETDASTVRVLPPRKGRPKEPLNDVSGINRIFELELVGGLGGKTGEREKELRRQLAEGEPGLCTMEATDSKGNSKGGGNKKKRKQPEPDEDEEEEEEVYAELARLRLEHNVKLKGTGQQSKSDPARNAFSAVSFIDDPAQKPPKRITVRTGDWVLCEVEVFNTKGEPKTCLEVAHVEEILEVESGDVHLGVHWAWRWGGMFDGATDDPATALKRTQQVFLQRDVCADGQRYVRGEDGRWTDTVSWATVTRTVTVLHRDEIPDLKAFSRKHNNGLSHFFYSMEFDHVIWRLSDIPPLGQAPKPPRRLSKSKLSMVDAFAGIGTVAMAGRLSGFQPRWAVESNEDAFSACNMNMDFTLDIGNAQSLEDFVAGVVAQKEGHPRKGDIALLHLSPPCQSLSKANYKTSLVVVESNLYPLLAKCVEAIKCLQPVFVTLEEVPDFLCKTVINSVQEGKAGGNTQVRPLLRMLAPLLDEGYQVDISVLNAVYYGVPQIRKRVFLMLAKHGYALPHRPPPRYHYEEPGFTDFMKNDVVRRDAMCWNKSYVSSLGLAAVAGEEDNSSSKLSARTPAEVLELQAQEAEKRAELALQGADADEGEDLLVGRCPGKLTGKNPLNLPLAITAQEAIGDLPEPEERPKQSAVKPLHYKPVAGAQSVFAKFMRQPITQGANPKMLLDHSRMNDPMAQRTLGIVNNRPAARARADTVFGTICGGLDATAPRGILHHSEDRLLTVAERKRIQTIPDDVHLWGNRAAVLKQVGNAIPMLLGRAVLDEVFTAATGLPPRPVGCLKGYGAVPEVYQERIAGDNVSQQDARKASDILEMPGTQLTASKMPGTQLTASKMPGTQLAAWTYTRLHRHRSTGGPLRKFRPPYGSTSLLSKERQNSLPRLGSPMGTLGALRTGRKSPPSR